jgi:hypothetical protein
MSVFNFFLGNQPVPTVLEAHCPVSVQHQGIAFTEAEKVQPESDD